MRRLRRAAAGVTEQANHPVNLAVLRIVIFGCLVASTDPARIGFFAALPEELLFSPFGSGWLLTLFPPDPDAATVVSIVFLVFSASACVGFRTRFSATVAVVLGLYVLLIPQAYGKVNHYHHLLWFGSLLAASPSGDALSVDRWLAEQDLGFDLPYARRYHTPFVFVWLLMGLIYLFPGLYKLAAGGWSLDWALSDNLRYFIWREWFDKGMDPSFLRIDTVPWLYRSLGVGVILFEVSFLFLVFLRPAHQWIGLAGVVFHMGTGLVMGIWFTGLLLCYVTFVDWRQLLVRSPIQPETLPAVGNEPVSRPHLPIVAVGTLLVVGVVVTGRYGIEGGWPIAAYPTFAEIRKTPYLETIQVRMPVSGAPGEWEEANQVEEELRESFGNIRFGHLLRRILREDDPEEMSRRLRGLAVLIRRTLGDDVELHFRLYRQRLSSRPGAIGDPYGRPRLLAEVGPGAEIILPASGTDED